MTSKITLCITIAALPLALLGCAAEKFDEPICAASSPITSNEASLAFASGYFPPEYGKPTLQCSFSGTPMPIVGEIESKWYPEQWQAASEPSLYEAARCEALPEFILRFSYIPSFDPSVFIRVQSDDEGLKLIAKELTGAGGYEPGELGRSKEIRLTDEQALELRKVLLSEALFDEPSGYCGAGLDGSQWVFELVDKDGYRMVKRWSPKEGAARNIGKYLIELSGWSFDPY